MTPIFFYKLVDRIFADLKELLTLKEGEYSQGGDRLDQFKKGATLINRKSHQVLQGFMLKHTTAIYDMLQEDNTDMFTQTRWREKIYDHINYLILLLAIVEENADNANRISVEKTFPEADAEIMITLPEAASRKPLPYQYPTPKGLGNDQKRT
jgi:hypothetical protein